MLHRHEGVKILDDNEESLYPEYTKAVGGGPPCARVLASWAFASTHANLDMPNPQTQQQIVYCMLYADKAGHSKWDISMSAPGRSWDPVVTALM